MSNFHRTIRQCTRMVLLINYVIWTVVIVLMLTTVHLHDRFSGLLLAAMALIGTIAIHFPYYWFSKNKTKRRRHK